jgi:hypothetical protein
VYFPEIRKKTFAVSSLVLNLLASQIGEFFLSHSVSLPVSLTVIWCFMLGACELMQILLLVKKEKKHCSDFNENIRHHKSYLLYSN